MKNSLIKEKYLIIFPFILYVCFFGVEIFNLAFIRNISLDTVSYIFIAKKTGTFCTVLLFMTLMYSIFKKNYNCSFYLNLSLLICLSITFLPMGIFSDLWYRTSFLDFRIGYINFFPNEHSFYVLLIQTITVLILIFRKVHWKKIVYLFAGYLYVYQVFTLFFYYMDSVVRLHQDMVLAASIFGFFALSILFPIFLHLIIKKDVARQKSIRE